MSIHWKELDTTGKIEAVRGVYQPGMSAAQVASHFDGATRNAVIGLFHRHLEKINGDWKLQKREAKPKRISLGGRVRTRHRQALPIPLAEIGEAHLCGRPLLMLARNECRWPVNEGESHLFCGQPSVGSYCDHHHARAFRSAA